MVDSTVMWKSRPLTRIEGPTPYTSGIGEFKGRSVLSVGKTTAIVWRHEQKVSIMFTRSVEGLVNARIGNIDVYTGKAKVTRNIAAEITELLRQILSEVNEDDESNAS